MKILKFLYEKTNLYFEEIFPFPHFLYRSTKLIQRAEGLDILDRQEFRKYKTLNDEQLIQRLAEERDRAGAMDEKTFKLTLSLSVGMSVLGSIGAFSVDLISLPNAHAALLACIFGSLFYVLSAGLIAVGALKTLRSYGYGTSTLLWPSEEKNVKLAEHLARQETMNIVRHLRNETAYQALRNGIILLVFSFCLFSASLIVQVYF